MLTAPGDRLPCRPGDLEHRQGFKIFLDEGSDDCGLNEGRPYVYAVGQYNVLEYPTPEDVIEASCASATGTVPPPDLAMGREVSASCREDNEDQIRLLVVAQSSEGVGLPPRINYFVGLVTTSERLEADLSEFRSILKTVRIAQ